MGGGTGLEITLPWSLDKSEILYNCSNGSYSNLGREASAARRHNPFFKNEKTRKDPG